MSQRKAECSQFDCRHIFRCVTFHGKNCIRQGGDKIPTQRAINQSKGDRANCRPFPRRRSLMQPYFIGR